MDANPVGRDLIELDRVEPGDHVGAEVRRSADLVQQLRRDGADRHLAAGAVVLADHRRAVGGDLDPREAEPGHARHLGEERVVATRRLGAALDDVPGDDASGEGIPVVACPAVVPRRRTAGDRGVGDATGDHDVGALGEGFDDPPATEVGVGGDELGVVTELTPVDERTDRARRHELVDPREHVVAVDVGDHRRQPELGGDVAAPPPRNHVDRARPRSTRP